MTQPSFLAGKTIALEIFNDTDGPKIVTMDVANNAFLTIHPGDAVRNAAIGTKIKIILRTGAPESPEAPIIELCGEVTRAMVETAHGTRGSLLKKDPEGVLRYVSIPTALDCKIYPTPQILAEGWTPEAFYDGDGKFKIKLIDENGALQGVLDLSVRCLHPGDTIKYQTRIGGGKLIDLSLAVTPELIAQLEDPSIEVIHSLTIETIPIQAVVPYGATGTSDVRYRLREISFPYENEDDDFICDWDLGGILAREHAAFKNLVEKIHKKAQPDPLLCSHRTGGTITDAFGACPVCGRPCLSNPGPLNTSTYLNRWERNKRKMALMKLQAEQKIARHFMQLKYRKIGQPVYAAPTTLITEPVVET